MATPATPISELPDGRQRLRERGMILVTTMVFLSLITVLCSAAIMRTANDIREGGAQRISQAALRLSEAGAMGTVALASQMQLGFGDYVAARNNVLTMADIGPAAVDLTTPDGSFGREFAAISPISFSTLVSESDMSAAVPGYDAARYCFKTYKMVTTSQIGSATPTDLLQIAQSGQQAIQSYLTVGPVLCGP